MRAISKTDASNGKGKKQLTFTYARVGFLRASGNCDWVGASRICLKEEIQMVYA